MDCKKCNDKGWHYGAREQRVAYRMPEGKVKGMPRKRVKCMGYANDGSCEAGKQFSIGDELVEKPKPSYRMLHGE